ncbi:MAG TPA: HAD family hydrolase [Rickettsiales bacterium]|nr:HAD family hydrolase [Rickettsiales bacterium]
MKKLFIFDFDGTLVDTKTIVKNGILDFSKENSLPVPDIDLICLGYSNPDNYDFGWGVDKQKQKEIMDKTFISISEKISNGTYIPTMFKNTEEILKILSENGSTLAICTSREKDACLNILEYYNIKKYFKIFKTREDVTLRNKKPKPNPELVLEIIDELSFKKENTFIVGDTDADIIAGKNANIKSVGVSWGYFGKEQIKNCNCDFIIDDFLELKNLI